MYFYHGYALGVASTIPGKEFTEADCALSIRGGSSSAKKSKNPLPKGISFQSAESKIRGWASPRTGLRVWLTEASVSIQKLNIQGIVTADRIEAHIYSEFRAGDYESSTVITGSKFDNLQVEGNCLTVETSDDLSARYPTFGKMQTAFQNGSSLDKVLASLVGRDIEKEDATSPDLLAAYEAYQEQKALPQLKSAVLCSFVAKVSGGGFKTWGPIITVPNFGNIYLGELLVWPWMRCLNLIRVELTPNALHPKGGTISVGSAGTNGTGWPPGSYFPG